MTYFSGLKEFIASWDDRFVEENPGEIFRESPLGNINTEGTAACADSPILSKYHRYFKKSIEPGVRDLTVALIIKFNCITYSSCQGHFSTSKSQMRPRYVGILPRDIAEYHYLFEPLKNIADLTNGRLPQNPVQVVLTPDTLESENCVMPCFNLFFISKIPDEITYFQELEAVYQTFLKLL
ncbi:hypothetical protein J0895_01165 [Phormidium pseudopriestleyi FRX01]|uniref:Uncharacterized protein n=1 Tax=Phormidium pseudopriestleyi FRX01 TaxID=1759528 RepID=A0ABS3FKV6_9CYAN|nr:hypothetical protein [Phormidium pseudopriestleyi]MBO0347740.1 hypothetical protein [Phormidium pseudopriestleyi FRX01]